MQYGSIVSKNCVQKWLNVATLRKFLEYWVFCGAEVINSKFKHVVFDWLLREDNMKQKEFFLSLKENNLTTFSDPNMEKLIIYFIFLSLEPAHHIKKRIHY